jgi:hypothetical protein
MVPTRLKGMISNRNFAPYLHVPICDMSVSNVQGNKVNVNSIDVSKAKLTIGSSMPTNILNNLVRSAGGCYPCCTHSNRRTSRTCAVDRNPCNNSLCQWCVGVTYSSKAATEIHGGTIQEGDAGQSSLGAPIRDCIVPGYHGTKCLCCLIDGW